ncbi:MAG: DUF2894 domain-containing protein [Deltaproteobacteria bacterium]|nr:DUF2894 domain-containing protein [Deltaproteobacteria bacterium]
MSDPLEALRERLVRGADQGLADFDRPRVRFVERLLERAEAGPEAATRRLLARAEERLAALEEDFERHRTEAENELERLESVGADPAGLARAAFERHAFREVRRRARRHPQRAPRTARSLGDAHARRLHQQLSERAPIEAAHAAAEGELLEVAQALYRERSADAVAQRTLADARRALPAEAGPYHALTVAARALGALEQADRSLLRAWIHRLRDIELAG